MTTRATAYNGRPAVARFEGTYAEAFDWATYRAREYGEAVYLYDGTGTATWVTGGFAEPETDTYEVTTKAA
jgi:hypothetical protein